MAKLKTLDLPETSAPSAEPPVVTVAGSSVADYAKASEEMTRAKKTLERLRPDLLKAGLQAIFEHNCACSEVPEQQVQSAVLLAGADASKRVRCTWTRKDSAPTVPAAELEQHFETLETRAGTVPNVNRYVAYVPQAAFDTSVFMVGGTFNQERYNDFMAALDTVSRKHKVENPLSLSQVLQTKPDFHVRRWRVFDAETNLKLHKLLPTTVSLTAL